MVVRKNRLTTDAVREVRHTFSRFLSILVLSALAVAFLAGLRAAAPDMEYTADNYYDRTHFMDGYVLSTLGLTEDDLAALAAADGVETVEGGRSLDATAVDSIVSVRSMPVALNLLNLTSGRLPERADECVTEKLLMLSLGLEVGDRLELLLEEEDADALERTAFTVVGVVESPLYVGPDRGTSSLGNGSVDAFVYVPGENFTSDIYTIAYFTGTGLAALHSYEDEYEDAMEALVDSLDGLGSKRAQLRYDSLIGDAQTELADAQAELDEARNEAEQALAEAWQQLQDARQELDEGWADYWEGRATLNRELANARQELADAWQQLADAQLALDEGRAQYEDGLAEYQSRRAEFEEGEALYAAGLEEYRTGLAQYEAARAQLDEHQAQVAAGYAQYDAALAPYVGTPAFDAVVAQLAEQKAQLDAAQGQLDEGYAQLALVKAQLDEAAAELEDTLYVLNAGRVELAQAEELLNDTARQLSEAQAAIERGQADYDSGRATLAREEQEGLAKLADALDALNTGETEYADGLQEYEDSRAEADEEIAEAQQKIDDAQAELDDLEECTWYVLGRNTNVGFVSYSQDAERVNNLASIFPVVFFLVAALASLTTMTRMVEEQRTQIGALKALGFSRLAISKKYIGYAFSASLVGGLLGLALGCTSIPAVIANAFDIMYDIPPLEFRPQTVLCTVAVAAAVLCTTGAALWACLSTLIDTPANLMRPKSPKAGRRVFLERIKLVWKRLSFTWKVTMRNLFRYQRRFWMTVIGIGGCTALIVTGFGLHESIFDILDKQFDEISSYDATVGLDEEADRSALDEVERYLAGHENVRGFMPCRQTVVDASVGGRTYNTHVVAVEDGETLNGFIELRHRLDSRAVALEPGGVIVTEKLSELLSLKVGDTLTLEGDRRVQAVVTDIVENYVYHYVYMDKALYTELFREEAADNCLLLAYAEGVDSAVSNEVSTRLMQMEGVLSYSYIATIRDSFTNSMSAINYAVIIIILAAAALAFVVLYNLTNINITERTRELATLKVLGFYDRETTAYIYRENIFLTIFGIILGLVGGKFFHSWMVVTVEVDIVMFGRTAPAYAYILAAVLTVLFSVIVNIGAHFKLKKVDMVESLKTVE